MPWLLRDGEVLASVEIATSWRERSRGLLGRNHVEGALLIRPAKSVHTLGMRFPLDVAFCDSKMVVIDCVRMRRWRLSAPRFKAAAVIEAEAGAFERWSLKAGDELEVKS